MTHIKTTFSLFYKFDKFHFELEPVKDLLRVLFNVGNLLRTIVELLVDILEPPVTFVELFDTFDQLLVTNDTLLVTIDELLVTIDELWVTFDATSLSSSPSPSNEIEERVETVEKDGLRTKVDTLPVVTL